MTSRNFALTLFLKSLLCLTLIPALTSCVQVEDEEPPGPEIQEVSFRVDLLKMKALDIRDNENDGLEVYGTVDTKVIRGNITEENNLWTADSDNYVAVGVSDVPFTGSVTYTLDSDQLAASTLEVIADLRERDFAADNPDDDLGRELIATPLSNITTTVTYDIVLNTSSGQHLQVTYSVTRL